MPGCPISSRSGTPAVGGSGHLPAALAAGGALVCGGVLVVAGPAGVLALTAALLVGLWWLSGPREGRRLREALLSAVALAVASGFVSSWLGAVAGIPAGAVLRDVAFVAVILASVSESRGGYPSSRLIAYGALAATVIVSIDTAGGLPAFVGARTYLLYPVLLLLPAWGMPVAERILLARGIVLILAAVAVIGLIEVATRGSFLTTLGYRTDFAETSTTSSSPYFAGFRRATGGLGNFLEFGLLMNIGLLLSRASLRGPARSAAMALFTVAAVLSWSRLAWALALIIAAIPLGVLGSARTRFQLRRLGGALVVVLIAVLALNIGPGKVLMNRISGTDRVTQRSNSTRADQLSLALSEAGTKLVGTGPGTQGAAADRQSTGPSRSVTDNGYLIWLLELGWLGLAAILTLSVLIATALVAAGAWWALSLLGVLAVSNALFAAADSRVVLVLSFISMRILWLSRDDAAPSRPGTIDPVVAASVVPGRSVSARRTAPRRHELPYPTHAGPEPAMPGSGWPTPRQQPAPARTDPIEDEMPGDPSSSFPFPVSEKAPSRGAGRGRRAPVRLIFLLLRIASLPGRGRRRR